MYKIGLSKMPVLALCMSAITCINLAAAQADDGSSGQTPQSKATSSPAQATAKKPFSLSRLPVYIAGVATGAFVGMPISLMRRFVWEEKQGIQGLCGDSTNKVAIVSAGAFWLPFSAFLGAGEAPVMGPVNSIKHYDKPFSKEQFSLGPIGDSSGRDPG